MLKHRLSHELFKSSVQTSEFADETAGGQAMLKPHRPEREVPAPPPPPPPAVLEAGRGRTSLLT